MGVGARSVANGSGVCMIFAHEFSRFCKVKAGRIPRATLLPVFFLLDYFSICFHIKIRLNESTFGHKTHELLSTCLFYLVSFISRVRSIILPGSSYSRYLSASH